MSRQSQNTMPPLSPKKSGVDPKIDPAVENPPAFLKDNEVIMGVWEGTGEERGKVRKQFKVHELNWQTDGDSGRWLYQLKDTDGKIYKDEDGIHWFDEAKITLAS